MKWLLFTTLSALSAACGSPKPATTATATPTPVVTSPPTPTAELAATTESPAAPPLDPNADLLAAEISAYETARPVFETWCVTCHQYAGGSSRTYPNAFKALGVSEYPFSGRHSTAKDIRAVLAIGGGRPSMPKNKKGAVQGQELAAIAAWADAWDRADAAGAHAAAE
jgi:mono/diheme cytochrome c family protein